MKIYEVVPALDNTLWWFFMTKNDKFLKWDKNNENYKSDYFSIVQQINEISNLASKIE